MAGERNTFAFDFGTTYCCVSTYRNDAPEALPAKHNVNTFPSTISYRNGEWQVGKHDIVDDPGDWYVQDGFKRALGGDKEDIGRPKNPVKHDGDGHRFFEIGNETLRVIVGVALFFLKGKNIYQTAMGKPPEQVALTVPAYFTGRQRQMVVDAARIAGLEVFRVINEPTAIAIAHLRKEDYAGTVLVADGGGGTFDLSLLNVFDEHGKRHFMVKAIAGDNELGGSDFRQVLEDLVRKELGDEEVNSYTLRQACEKAKKDFTATAKYLEINIAQRTTRIPTKRYLDACKPLFENIGKVVQSFAPAAREAKPDMIIYGGGCTYHPGFKATIEKTLTKARIKVKTLDRQQAGSEVVSLGAAVYACAGGVTVSEVLPRPVGIEVVTDEGEDIMEIALNQYDAVPASFNGQYDAASKRIWIRIYEGAMPKASDNSLLGKFSIQGRKGNKVEVNIEATADSTFKVTAKTRGGSGTRNVTSLVSDFTEAEIQSMKAEALEKYRSGEPSFCT